jgi:hypothetical protein
VGGIACDVVQAQGCQCILCRYYYRLYRDCYRLWNNLKSKESALYLAMKIHMEKVIVSKISTYDHDDQLWYTKVGLDETDMPLLAIAAGKTVTESKERANQIKDFFQLSIGKEEKII